MSSPLQAVILAGGLGTRLSSLNLKVPKPLVPVAGQPFLTHLLRMLQRRGFRNFLFLLGFQGDVMLDYLQHSAPAGAQMHWSIEPAPLGTAGALKHAEALIQDEFILIYGDSYLDMDYLDLARTFTATGSDSIMVVYDNRQDTDVVNNVAMDHERYVVDYSKAGQHDHLTHVEAGVLAFRKRVLNHIPVQRIYSLEKELFPKLIAARAMRAYETTQRFYDIGTPARLQAFVEVLNRDHLPNPV